MFMSQSPPGTGNCLLVVYIVHTESVATGHGTIVSFKQGRNKDIIYFAMMGFPQNLHEVTAHVKCTSCMSWECLSMEMLSILSPLELISN